MTAASPERPSQPTPSQPTPSQPTLSAAEVTVAAERIAGRTRHTPLLAPADPHSAGPESPWLKCEFLQHTGVFKVRGAFNRQLAARERGELDPAVGVVAASGGNAGLANAFAARELGVPAIIFVPQNAPMIKVQRLLSYGAEVRQVGREYVEAWTAAQEHVARTGALFCHAYDQVEVVAGAGTIGLEILTDLPDVDTVVLAVGGGGLFAGVAAAVGPNVRIVAAEPASCPTLRAALDHGRPVDVPVGGVAADSLGARRIGEVAFRQARLNRPHAVLIDEDAIVGARADLWRSYRIPSEYGPATAYAALTSGAYRPAPGERVVVVISGANTDPATLV